MWFIQSLLIVLTMLAGLIQPAFCGDDSVQPFELRTSSGQVFSLDASSEQDFRLTVVCFLGTECPLAKLYAIRLNDLAETYASQGVRFIGVDSNRQDSEEELSEFAEKHQIVFPVAKDHRNIVADLFNAQRTPEVFVIDDALTIRYQGRIDDQYLPGVTRAKPTRQDLRAAINELLTDKPVTRPKTAVKGCLLGRVKKIDNDSKITFSDQVSRLLQKHCVECHRTGEIGPFSLTDYDEIAGWADMIVEVIDDGRMPPWHANPEFGSFVNERIMTETDKQLIRDWVAAGAPFGDPKLLPPPYRTQPGWNLPKQPDLVVAMREKPFVVPAEGTVEYQYFVVDPGFKEDKWVVAAQVLPGNRSVVHHSIVFVRPPDGVNSEGIGWLGAYVPGQRQTTYPRGYGRRIPAGSKFVFQQHYTPVGSQQSDITKVGIVFGDETEITDKVYTLIALEQDFEIPAHAKDHPVTATLPYLPPKAMLLAIAPHMHFRGKSFRVMSKRGDQDDILLDVPNYDFNWQHLYTLQNPISLDSLDEINFVSTFDNSENNPANPDPTKPVFWGHQTWEEMAVAFFEVAETREQADVGEDESNQPVFEPELSENEQRLADKFVDDVMNRFDKNKDGIVTKAEVPMAIRRFGFHEFDIHGDGTFDRKELELVAKWEFYNHDERATDR